MALKDGLGVMSDHCCFSGKCLHLGALVRRQQPEASKSSLSGTQCSSRHPCLHFAGIPCLPRASASPPPAQLTPPSLEGEARHP